MKDGEYRQKLLEDLRTRCVFLTTKESFLGLPEANDRPDENDEGIFWCEKTTDMLGPDGSEVCSRACGKPGRNCYEGPVQL